MNQDKEDLGQTVWIKTEQYNFKLYVFEIIEYFILDGRNSKDVFLPNNKLRAIEV